jgi:hypothetical protein
VARGFAVFTDNHVQQAVADGLVAAEWDVVRAIDVFPAGTADAVLFEHATLNRSCRKRQRPPSPSRAH